MATRIANREIKNRSISEITNKNIEEFFGYLDSSYLRADTEYELCQELLNILGDKDVEVLLTEDSFGWNTSIRKTEASSETSHPAKRVLAWLETRTPESLAKVESIAVEMAAMSLRDRGTYFSNRQEEIEAIGGRLEEDWSMWTNQEAWDGAVPRRTLVLGEHNILVNEPYN